MKCCKNEFINEGLIEILYSCFPKNEKEIYCQLATVKKDGSPHLCTISVYEFYKDSFVFFTNKNTLKWANILSNKKVCLGFFNPEKESHIQVKGEAFISFSEEELKESWTAKPASIKAIYMGYREDYPDHPPDNFGKVKVEVSSIETLFLHPEDYLQSDRRFYTKCNDGNFVYKKIEITS